MLQNNIVAFLKYLLMVPLNAFTRMFGKLIFNKNLKNGIGTQNFI